MASGAETEPDGAGRIRGAETARRTVRLLEVLATRAPLLLDELAAEIGLNRSTVYRLLRVLQEEGWAERLPEGGYRLGPAVGALAARAPLPDRLVNAAVPVLRELAEATGESVHVHRRAGDTVVLAVGVESEQHALRLVTRVGDTHALWVGCAAHAVLAGLAPGDRDAVLSRAALRQDARRALERDLDQVLAQGYALSRGANNPGLFGIAAPVPPPRDDLPTELSVSVSGPEGRWTEDRAVRHLDGLLRCCTHVSHVLSPGW